MSIDDTIRIFQQLTDSKPKSIFNLPFFHYFKVLHDRFGLVLSCYCFWQYKDFTLAVCTRDYRSEFEANSNWLRFGFHGYNPHCDYGKQNELDSEKQYNLVMNNLAEIVGYIALDEVIRIHKFSATKTFVKYMNSAKYPIKGLFSSDDNRISYSLSLQENNFLIKTGSYNYKGIKIIQTTQRFDSIKPWSIFLLFAKFNNGGGKYLFTHEYVFFPITFKMKLKGLLIRSLIKCVCVYHIFFLGYKFQFPINKNS